MNREALFKKFDALNVWERKEERAPHKPLLALLALARASRGDYSPIPFADVDRELTPLLKEFGQSRSSYHPEYPFFYLKNDGVWTVDLPKGIKPRKGKQQPTKGELLAHNVKGELTPEVQAALRADPSLIAEIANRLLQGHFPDSYHDDILSAVGLDLDTVTTTKRKRDPCFRKRVLIAYQYRCAVCRFALNLRTVPVALDAAHIRWHQNEGPDTEDNGLALCSLHHKTFDFGAFTLRDDGVLLVSEEAMGGGSFAVFLLNYHGKGIDKPQRPEHEPAPQFLAWHRDKVFKGAARHLG
jgi:putative restriction endonuclease